MDLMEFNYTTNDKIEIANISEVLHVKLEQ